MLLRPQPCDLGLNSNKIRLKDTNSSLPIHATNISRTYDTKLRRHTTRIQEASSCRHRLAGSQTLLNRIALLSSHKGRTILKSGVLGEEVADHG